MQVHFIGTAPATTAAIRNPDWVWKPLLERSGKSHSIDKATGFWRQVRQVHSSIPLERPDWPWPNKSIGVVWEIPAPLVAMWKTHLRWLRQALWHSDGSNYEVLWPWNQPSIWANWFINESSAFTQASFLGPATALWLSHPVSGELVRVHKEAIADQAVAPWLLDPALAEAIQQWIKSESIQDHHNLPATNWQKPNSWVDGLFCSSINEKADLNDTPRANSSELINQIARLEKRWSGVSAHPSPGIILSSVILSQCFSQVLYRNQNTDRCRVSQDNPQFLSVLTVSPDLDVSNLPLVHSERVEWQLTNQQNQHCDVSGTWSAFKSHFKPNDHATNVPLFHQVTARLLPRLREPLSECGQVCMGEANIQVIDARCLRSRWQFGAVDSPLPWSPAQSPFTFGDRLVLPRNWNVKSVHFSHWELAGNLELEKTTQYSDDSSIVPTIDIRLSGDLVLHARDIGSLNGMIGQQQFQMKLSLADPLTLRFDRKIELRLGEPLPHEPFIRALANAKVRVTFEHMFSETAEVINFEDNTVGEIELSCELSAPTFSGPPRLSLSLSHSDFYIRISRHLAGLGIQTSEHLLLKSESSTFDLSTNHG